MVMGGILFALNIPIRRNHKCSKRGHFFLLDELFLQFGFDIVLNGISFMGMGHLSVENSILVVRRQNNQNSVLYGVRSFPGR